MTIRKDLHKLNGWLKGKEKGRLEIDKASTHDRRRRNDERRKAYERKLRWIERHRAEYNAKMREVMRRRRDEEGLGRMTNDQ